jgi:NADH-quinone oxidoreductase subunit N
MLYGMSLLYGLAGSTELHALRAAAAGAPPLLVLTAVALCLGGLGYKIAVVPFHMWCPDVYEGAPTPVTAFLSVAPKAAGFALLLRFLGAAVPLEGALPRSPWLLLLLLLAVVTMTVGNLGALVQRSAKRLLAYSSIAHAGFLLLGLAAGPAGTRALLLYLAIYLFMNLTAFVVVAFVVDATGSDDVDAFRGLGRRAPAAALALAIALVALTGLPPTAGFIAKYALFSALLEEASRGGGAVYVVVALLAVLNSVLSLGYYARLLRAMYLDRTPGADAARPLPLPTPHLVLLALLAVPTLLFGLDWTPLGSLVDRSLALWAAGS